MILAAHNLKTDVNAITFVDTPGSMELCTVSAKTVKRDVKRTRIIEEICERTGSDCKV